MPAEALAPADLLTPFTPSPAFSAARAATASAASAPARRAAATRRSARSMSGDWSSRDDDIGVLRFRECVGDWQGCGIGLDSVHARLCWFPRGYRQEHNSSDRRVIA